MKKQKKAVRTAPKNVCLTVIYAKTKIYKGNEICKFIIP